MVKLALVMDWILSVSIFRTKLNRNCRNFERLAAVCSEFVSPASYINMTFVTVFVVDGKTCLLFRTTEGPLVPYLSLTKTSFYLGSSATLSTEQGKNLLLPWHILPRDWRGLRGTKSWAISSVNMKTLRWWRNEKKLALPAEAEVQEENERNFQFNA